MRLCGLLVLFGLATSCGGSDEAGEAGSPSVNVETVVVTTDTGTDAATDVASMEPPTIQKTALVPPGSELNNEGDVLLEVRTEEGELDTVWLAESSGFPEVDEFALDHIRTSEMKITLGWGDPPFRMMVYVRIPNEPGDGISPPNHEASEASEFIPIPLTVPRESEIRNEGDVIVEARLAGELIDTAWVAVSSGYPEVDELAMDHLDKNQSVLGFSGYPEDQPIRLRVLVRQPSDRDVD